MVVSAVTVEAGDNAAVDVVVDMGEIEAGDNDMGLSESVAGWCKTGTYWTWAKPYPPAWPGTATGTVRVMGTATGRIAVVGTRSGSYPVGYWA